MESHKPIELNFQDIRNMRQQNNNKIVYHSIKNNNQDLFEDNINKKELERTLEDLKYTKNDLFNKCQIDDKFCIVISRLISKNASRQGSKDEYNQLITCNITAQKYNIKIENLNATDFRPTKDGCIVSQNEMKQKKISKDCCLKSFDGKITGKLQGFISAKVAYGSGGHQDNVFEEMDTVADWWKKYKSESQEKLILLIETDQVLKLKRLKEKYNLVCNIMVCNHIEFQQYIINNFYTESRK